MLSMGVVVLAKGSQNGVYAEEAVKLLLSDSADTAKLVRQSGYWPKKKGPLFVVL
jgi:UDP-N-acetylmuramoyl-tripeptide--D-alanyl-D-alanine ligase